VHRFLAPILLLLHTVPGLAQPLPGDGRSDYLVRTWTTEDGLPVNSIISLAQTPDGYLWLATGQGLVRFDGLKFRVFGQGELPGWSSQYITLLHVDRQGRLWAGSQLGDVGVYERGRLRTIAHRPEQVSGETAVMTALEAPGGTLWFGRASAGLLRVRGTEARTFGRSEGLSEKVHDVQRDPQGRVVVVTKRGLYRLTGERFVPVGPRFARRLEHYMYRLHDSTVVEVVAGTLRRYSPDAYGLRDTVAPPKRIWRIGSAVFFYREDGLYRRMGAQTVRLAGPDDLPEVSEMGTFGDGIAWVSGKRPGTVHFAFADGREEAVPTGNPSVRNTWAAQLRDAEGNLWVGTNAGLVRLTPRRVQAVTERDGLRAPMVWALRQTRDGSIWMATFEGGLSRLAPDGQLRTFGPSDGLPGTRFRTLLEDRQGRLWAGGADGGAVLHNAQVQRIIMPTGEGTQWNVFVQTRDGTIWGGADRVERITETPEGRFVVRAETSGVYQAKALLEDRAGRLWAGAINGLFVRERGRWRQQVRPDGRPYPTVIALTETADGSLWVGTQGVGLYRMHPNGSVFAYSKALNGLPHDGIWAIQDDGRGHFWMNSDAGLFRIPKADFDAVAEGRAARLRALVLTEADGMPSAEGCAGKPAMMIDRAGRLWSTTIAGAVVVDLSTFRAQVRPPTVVVENVVANGVRLDSLPPRFAPGTRNFAFDYTALTLTQPEAARFRVRLSGVDRDWSPVTTRRAAFYTNVSPGRHRFEVQAANADGLWNEAGATYAFAVSPFWWQTPWAWGLVALLVVGVIAGAWRVQEHRLRTTELEAEVRTRTQELRAANANLEVQRAEIAAQNVQLEALDRMKGEFFANISHEFRTPLQLVLGPLQDLLGQDDLNEGLLTSLSTVERNALRLNRLVNSLFDLARLDAEGLALHLVPADLVGFVQEVADAFLPLAQRQQVRLVFRAEARVLPVSFDAVRMEVILGNLIANAIKFTPPGGHVVVTIGDEEDRALVRVRDSGIGIATEHLPRLFDRFFQVDGATTREREGAGIGLAHTAELVRLHGGTLVAASDGPDLGATFTLALPLVAGTALAAVTPSSQRLRPHLVDLAGLEMESDLQAARPEENMTSACILIVDDNREMRRLLHTQLDADFNVAEAVDGHEALARLREGRFDAVVADVMMPRLDGLDLVRTLRADPDLADVPVLLLTARSGTAHVAEGLHAGADDYLAKPYDASELRARLHRLVNARQMLRARYQQEVVLQPTGLSLQPRDAAFLERVRTIVSERMDEHGFDVWSLALDLKISASQLDRRLKPLTGRTPAKLILEMRIQRAAELLTAGTPVHEAAARVGLKDADTFVKRFRERYGMTPSEYRANGASSPGQ
jgi:signal transduction histidine kinase/ligand-binding sensor domain-containing protein/DNA-binding response OmpR family regulator